MTGKRGKSKRKRDRAISAVTRELLKLGFALKRDKVADRVLRLWDSFQKDYDVSKMAQICLDKCLSSDLNSCGTSVLPPLNEHVHKTTLDGPFILQVHEIRKFGNQGLKFKLTDGVQTVKGVVVKPVADLDVCAPPGLKVKISNVTVRRGRLVLLPENIIVLGGGLVDDPSHSDSTSHTETLQPSNLEGCNKTSGLVVCFGETLIDFRQRVGRVSLAEVPTFKKALSGAANVAVGISKLGGSSAVISKVGADEFGYMLADILKQNDIDTSGMRFDYNSRTILAFATLGVDGKRNERKFLFSRNPRDHMLLDESELDHNLIKKAKIFHYGSISLIDEPCKSAHRTALRIAKESGCILSYDPNLRLGLWPSDEAARKGIMSIWDQADVIKISAVELAILTDKPHDDVAVFQELLRPNHKLLIVTEGSNGCRYYTNDFKGQIGGFCDERVDITGVDDAFVSGILYEIASDPNIFQDKERLHAALYSAHISGAIKVTEPALPYKRC